MAGDTLRNFVIAGVAPEKVMIDPEEFAAWCKTRRKRNNASSPREVRFRKAAS
jgi:hypothetical protein